MRDRDSTTVPHPQLAEKTVKLILIHASVDSLNSLNLGHSGNSDPFRENPFRENPIELLKYDKIGDYEKIIKNSVTHVTRYIV